MSATSMLSTVGSMGFSSSGDLLLPFFPSVGVDGADPSATSGRPDVRNDDCGAVTGPVFAFSASFCASLFILPSTFFFSDVRRFPKVL